MKNLPFQNQKEGSLVNPNLVALLRGGGLRQKHSKLPCKETIIQYV